MSEPTRLYPSLKVDTAGVRVVSNAGAVLLVQTATTLGWTFLIVARRPDWAARTALSTSAGAFDPIAETRVRRANTGEAALK